ncbi:uncharacterized PKHD-type hydroxylase At1g22950-like isoform X1, partial [Fagus crenata]
VQRHREYRQKIISNYQPLHRELYTMHKANFFVPSFLKAIDENTKEGFRSIMVENFERWVHETKFRIMRPNNLMENFICPMFRVFFPEVGGSTLDSHHGFVVEYGMDRDVELGFHVDDSEVTLNVCLGRKVLVLCFILRYLFFSLSPT